MQQSICLHNRNALFYSTPLNLCRRENNAIYSQPLHLQSERAVIKGDMTADAAAATVALTTADSQMEQQ